MTVRLYMDQNVPRQITVALRGHGVDVLTAYEDGTSALADSLLLERATALGRVVFTRDDDFLREASSRQAAGIAFSGVIYVHQRRLTIGECVENLALIALSGESEDVINQVLFLPL